MAYVKTVYVNDNPPAINASNLNKMEQGIYDNDKANSELKSDLIDRYVPKDNAIEGYYINSTNGTISANVNFDYIEFYVIEGDTLEYFANHTDSNIGMAFYDMNGTYISGVGSSSEVILATVPQNAYMAKAAYRHGSSSVAYVKTVKNINAVSEKLYSMCYDINKTVNRHVPKDNVVEGYYINSTNGGISANASFDYIEFYVIEGDTLEYFANRADSNIGMAFYDMNGSYISGVESSAVVVLASVPQNAYIARASYRHGNSSVAYVKTVKNINTVSNKLHSMCHDINKTVNCYVPKTNAVDGYAVNSNDGTVSALANFSYIEFNVLANSSVAYSAGRVDSNVGMAFYDMNGTYISGAQTSVTEQIIAVPSNAVIARACYRTAFSDNAYVKILTNMQPVIDKLSNIDNSIIATKRYSGMSMFDSIQFLGDSYTQGGMKSSDLQRWIRAKKPFPEVISAELGVNITNYGVGGASVRSYQTTTLPTVLQATAPDLYFLCFGINDAGNGDTIGTVSDIHDDDYTQNPDTFYGNYGRIISQLMAHAPLARFVIFGQWHWNSSGIYYMDYTEAAKGVAEHFNIPFVNPFDDSFFNTTLYRGTMVSGHPTQVTYTGMAHAIMRLMEQCLANNSLYYRYAGLESLS